MSSKAFSLLAFTTAIFSGGAAASPAPVHPFVADLGTRASAAAPNITLCSAPEFNGICLFPSVVSDACVDLTGGMAVLNKELSSARIPAGFVCTFFTQSGCTTITTADSRDELGLAGGSYPAFSMAIGIAGPQNFEDIPSSYSCSPL
ncbi:hypothetical protein VKT23_019811 [Stygiomarasmius scandens]|uniref:Uncharacterized protein n=1 Tax=Marasmiellus scandens TaxID=2682957 RepID=A0ABR1ILU6_9AGAR